MFHTQIVILPDVFYPATPGLFISREEKEQARPVALVSTSQDETHRLHSFRERERDVTTTLLGVVFLIPYFHSLILQQFYNKLRLS